jgi:glyoxylase-like metal-dependent hydrolase (beta-lactamase superfamily II)
MRISALFTGVALAAFSLAAAAPALAQQRSFDDVEIKTTKLADGLYELEGAGGNIGLSVGEDGVLMIDDQFAPLTPKIKAAIEAITDQPVKFVINTHYHPDHTGGNEAWGNMDAIIVAQKNVRERLKPQTMGDEPRFGAAALPVITVAEGATFHWNGDTITAHHLPNAHTDGDIALFFHKANVIHMGDVWRTVSYPRVDGRGGGSMKGIIDGLDYVVSIAGPDTRFLPGHGVVSSRDDVAEVVAMMKTIWNRVAEAKTDGKSLEKIKASKPTKEFDARWATEQLPGDLIVEQIYNELP